MSINEATPEQWDELRKKHPALVDKYEKFLEERTIETEETAGYDDYVVKVPKEDRVDLNDVVNNPHHYNVGSIECIEAIKESMSRNSFKGYLKGNCMKYIWRYEYKDKAKQDLEKAQWYLNLLISEVE